MRHAVDRRRHRRFDRLAVAVAMRRNSSVSTPPARLMMSSILMRWRWTGVSWSSPTISSSRHRACRRLGLSAIPHAEQRRATPAKSPRNRSGGVPGPLMVAHEARRVRRRGEVPIAPQGPQGGKGPTIGRDEIDRPGDGGVDLGSLHLSASRKTFPRDGRILKPNAGLSTHFLRRSRDNSRCRNRLDRAKFAANARAMIPAPQQWRKGMWGLDGRTILVTGASGGIGGATVRQLVARRGGYRQRPQRRGARRAQSEDRMPRIAV